VRLSRVCRSTGFRTALLYAALFGTSVLVLCGVVYWQTARYMERQLHAVVDADIWSLTASTEPRGLAALRDAIRARLAAARTHTAWYLLLDPGGTVVAGNLPALALPPGWAAIRAPRGGDGTATRAPRKGHLVLGRGLPLADGAFLFVGHDAHQLEEMRELLVGALGWGVGVTFVLAVVGGAVMGTGTLRRVDAINRVAGEIVRGDLSRRMPVRGTDNEFDILAQHLNHMLERMQALMEGMRQVTNDIAHDLRTPLGRLRQRLEGVRREATTVAEYQWAVDQALDETDQILETFAALLLYVNSWRWQGVPFYIRAGKSLPVTCTEIVVRLRRPPTVFPTCSPAQNYFRFRISPEVTGAFGLTVMDPEEKMIGQQVELLAHHHPGAEEVDAYERVLGDAMAGDPTLFAREDYVEEAWRIVDPVLKAGTGTPVYEYEPGTWGPGEVDQRVVPAGGWQNPTLSSGMK